LLAARPAYKRFFRADRDPYYSLFNTGDYTKAEWKVAWGEQSSQLEAAVVGKIGSKRALVDHKVMTIACDSEEEGHYLAGVLNSTLFRYAVSSYAIEVQMGPHLLDNICVPKYSEHSTAHRKISRQAKHIASQIPTVDEGEIKVLDNLCAQLWGIEEKGFKVIRSAYRELHGLDSMVPVADESDGEK